jgi:RimJ/RimL family protein N-acetyltransferase
MTLRDATSADAAEIERMGLRFLSDEGPYRGRFKTSPEALRRLLELMLRPTALALVLEAEPGRLVGMFGAFLFEHPITGQRVASELCWWVDPEARGASVKATSMVQVAVRWAQDAGAEWFEVIAPNERISAFYERIGFYKADTHHVKVLTS